MNFEELKLINVQPIINKLENNKKEINKKIVCLTELLEYNYSLHSISIDFTKKATEDLISELCSLVTTVDEIIINLKNEANMINNRIRRERNVSQTLDIQ